MVNSGCPVTNHEEQPANAESHHKRRRRKALKAHVYTLSEDSMKCVQIELAKIENMYLSLSEMISFIFDDVDQLLEIERDHICVQFFSFSIIQHNMLLVKFYTGLPDASQFFYVSSMIERNIFPDYVKWEAREKQGFMTHTMMCLMKLRLGMTDVELAERFKVEPYVVNMTIRMWIPALTKMVYKACQDIYRYPAPHSAESFTKILDVVEVCLETPEFTRKIRDGRHQRRRAVLGVRSDGYVCFAGDVLSEYVPEDVLVKRSKFAATKIHNDVVLVHPELQHTLTSMGFTSRQMTAEASEIIAGAADRMADYKILAAIPEEYASIATNIYKTCAGLSNFLLLTPDDEDV